MLFPAIAAGLSFLPLLRSYKTVMAGTLFADMFRAGFHQLPAFYLMLLSPAILILVLALIVFAARQQGLAGLDQEHLN